MVATLSRPGDSPFRRDIFIHNFSPSFSSPLWHPIFGDRAPIPPCAAAAPCLSPRNGNATRGAISPHCLDASDSASERKARNDVERAEKEASEEGRAGCRRRPSHLASPRQFMPGRRTQPRPWAPDNNTATSRRRRSFWQSASLKCSQIRRTATIQLHDITRPPLYSMPLRQSAAELSPVRRDN